MLETDDSKLFVTWDIFEQQVDHIAAQFQTYLKHTKSHPHTIVGVTRGGLIPAVMLSHKLQIPTTRTITVKTYGNEHTKKASKKFFGKVPDGWGLGTGLIIVDDISDTGETFEYLREFLPMALYVAIYAKNPGINVCNMYGVEVKPETWVEFPWEI